MSDFEQKLSACSTDIERKLENVLSEATLSHPHAAAPTIVAAMRYACLGGGKRIRPFLLQECAALFGVDRALTHGAGAAIEAIHCYSLVHDDLPAMDDDDMRRGKPSVHIEFGEANAILAGDGLLTHAFDILANQTNELPSETRLALIGVLSRHAGVGGMVGGQSLDMDAEGTPFSERDVRLMQEMKTGALLQAACQMGGIIGKADTPDMAQLMLFGARAGAAFQLADDLLDLTSDAATMGKQVGKDADRGKGTLVGLLGETSARIELARLVEEAGGALEGFGVRAATLKECVAYIADRTH